MNAFSLFSIHGLATVLAAQSTEQKKVLEGLLWMGVIIVALVFAAALITYLRKRVVSQGDCEAPDFTLDQLRRLKEAGRLTPIEYETLKKRAIDGFNQDKIKDVQ
ncbi:MAG: hypothetical protein JSU63_12270 [Phycisphaerales bacterium]|nr:MAG: hypothetical protein JSU63_12270 [Phycisphaerales bacterium]